MSITRQNVVIVYRQSDSDSEQLADDYISRYNLNSVQKIAVPCSNNEILDSETEFNNQVLTSLKSSIDALENNDWNIKAIVLGYNIPGGFRDGDDIISSTSRASRIHHTYSKKRSNYLYDRKDYKSYDDTDATFALVASRIDAPTFDLAKAMIDNAEILDRQNIANGTFYIDPYSDKLGGPASAYEDSILDFKDNILPLLNLDIFSTVFLDPYIDVVIPRVENDSFIWSWFTDRSSMSFFGSTDALRIFAYNADYSGANTVRSIITRHWPALAIRNGYIATAGAMSNPTIEGFLSPRAFFETLLRDGNIGEAYLFSLPFLDWTMTLFGDPLAIVVFPSEPEEDDTIDEDESFRLMSIDLARAITYQYRRSSLLEEAFVTIVSSIDVATEVDLLYRTKQLYDENSDASRNGHFVMLVEKYYDHILARKRETNVGTINPTINDYLQVAGFKVSEMTLDSFYDSDIVNDIYVKDMGEWTVEVPIIDEAGDFVLYHFELEVSFNENFSTILFVKDSQENQTGWFYERNENEFIDVPTDGVASNFAGNRIRYVSNENEYLTRGRIVYFRIKQKDSNNEYQNRNFRDVIHT